MIVLTFTYIKKKLSLSFILYISNAQKKKICDIYLFFLTKFAIKHTIFTEQNYFIAIPKTTTS